MQVFTRRAAASLMGAVGTLTALTLLSRILGFFRWIAQSAWVGSNQIAGAYATANQIPNVITEILAGGALAGAVVPLVALPLAKSLRKQVSQVASTLLTWTLLILIPAAAILVWAAPVIARLLPVPIDADTEYSVRLITHFLRIFALQIPLYGISVVLTGILQAHRKFFLPALAPALSSTAVIATYFGYGMLHSHESGARPDWSAIDLLAWGTTLGVLVLSLPLFIPVYRLGIKLRPQLHLPQGQGGRALRLGAAGVTALLAQQFAVITVLAVARAYGEGGTVAVFQYTTAVYLLPYAVLVTPLVTAIYPRLSQAVESSHLIGVLTRGNQRIFAVSTLALACLWAGAGWAREFFTVLTVVEGMDTTLSAMTPGLFGYGILLYYTRALYAVDRAQSAVWANTIGWLTVAVASVIFARLVAPMGGDGPRTLVALGAAQSVGMVAGAALATVMFTHIFGRGVWHGFSRGMLVLLPAGLISIFAGYLLSPGVIIAPAGGLVGLVFQALALVSLAVAPVALALGYLYLRRERHPSENL